MPSMVTAGAALTCSMGTLPTTLAVAPTGVSATAPIATVMDFAPANVPPFGMCLSLANPAVAAATSAASGVLTPQPCTPALASPWAPGSLTAAQGGAPCLLATSKCACTFAGVISITTPGQLLVSGS